MAAREIHEIEIKFSPDQKVMLDFDPAELCGVETKRLNEQARRNIHEFSDDSVFQLAKEEFEKT